MDLLTDIAFALAAVVAFLVAAALARNARLLDSVYTQQERRRRGEQS